MTEHDARIEREVATALWKPIGTFGLALSIALLAGMASEKADQSVLSFIGQNPHAITLFGIPILACTLMALSIIGRAFSSASKHEAHWTGRFPPIVENVSRSSLRALAAIIILTGFLLVPWITLGLANRKFLDATYYFNKDAAKGCEKPDDCEKVGSGWAHFRPRHGISLANTPYRYEGNKSYIPILYPTLFICISLAASYFVVRYLLSLFAKI